MVKHSISSIVFLLTAVASAAEPTAAQLEFFESKIRPVLVENCYECHSTVAATAKKLKGALLLDSRDGAQKGGETGPAVVPSKPDESLLIRAIRQQDELEMPPAGKLPDSVIADFVKWIEMGAPDPRDRTADVVAVSSIDFEAGRRHWAFQPLQPVLAPDVKDTAWVRTPIDRFIRARQEAAGITPNDTADAGTLARRAYYDLIGLPPSVEELERFVNDVGRRNLHAAYGDLIDRLLANAHHGERWARHWLDIARFAESHGYAFDGNRPNAWHYRDFVIGAFNADMPYNEFVRRQVAGDLLANLEAETSDEARATLELVAATGFLAAGPFTTQQTQKERERSRYEQLDDLINTLGTSMLGLTVGCSRCHDHKYDPLPQYDYYRLASCFAEIGFSDTGVNLQPEAFRTAMAAYDAAHTPLVAARTDFEREKLPGRLERWLKNRKDEPSGEPALAAWHHIGPFTGGDAFKKVFPPEIDTDLEKKYKDDKLAWKEQPEWKDGEAHNDTLKGDNSANYLLRVIEAPEPRVLSLSLGSDDGIKLWVNQREVLSKNVKRDVAKADQETAMVQLAPGRNELLMKIVNRGGKSGFYFQASDGQTPADVSEVLAKDAEKRNADERQKALDWYKGFEGEWLKLNAAVYRHATLEPQPDLTHVFAAQVRGKTYEFGDNTYKVFHLRRGNAANKEEEASPGFLQVLMRTQQQEKHWLTASDAAKKPSPRVALADWLTDTRHGSGDLLARVIVNRLWYHHFGRGIVATPSDFGTRGERPSHPELLDWLAGELIRGGWKLKPIHKLIMISAVSMQAGEVTESGRRQDAENLLFWRRNSRRLDAEIIRDAMLAVSGTLDPMLYGKGTLDQKVSTRRSIYFTVKRGQLIPLLQLFDAPDAMQGIGRREESTVASQALALMNSPIVHGLAIKFAQRIRPSVETSIEDAIERAWRTALSRSPDDDDRASMKAFIQHQTESRAGDADAESLAVQDFCHLLLCMNEFVYVD